MPSTWPASTRYHHQAGRTGAGGADSTAQSRWVRPLRKSIERVTVAATNNPAYSALADAPEGVPISAIVFGGRRKQVAPLPEFKYEKVDVKILYFTQLLGMALGLGAAVFVGAAESTGDMLAVQMGLSGANVLNPISGTSMPILGQFLGLFVGEACERQAARFSHFILRIV